MTYDDLNRPLVVVDPRTASSINSRRPNQSYLRQVRADKAVGNSIYHALQSKLERRMSKGVTFLAAYTYSKSISGPSDIGGQVGGGSFIGSPQDYYNMKSDRAVSGFDVTQRFVQTVLWDIPFAHNLRGVSQKVLDGWQVSTIMTVQSGFPAGIGYGVDTTGTGIGSRPDMLAGVSGNLSSDKRTYQKWFNTDAFAYQYGGQSFFGRFGSAPRTNAIRLPGVITADFSIHKQVKFKESRSIEIRSEFFNLFNHYNPDPGTVDLGIRNKTFGTIGGGVQGITTRVIQLGAKLNF